MRTNARRTPERRGGVLKKLMIAIGIVLLIVTILIASEIFAALTARGTITTDYGQIIHDRTLERQRALATDGPNQWPQFRDVIDAVEAGSADLEQRNAAAPPDPDDPFPGVTFYIITSVPEGVSFASTADLRVRYREARQRGIEALDQWRDMGIFDAAADLPGLTRVAMPSTGQPAVEYSPPELGLARQLVRAQAARMRLAAEAGDDAQRLAAFEQSAALARITAGMGSILGWFTGGAIEGMAVEEMLDGVHLYPPAADRWLVAADAIIQQQLVTLHPTIADIMKDQRDTAHDHVQHVYDASGRFIPRNHARLSYTYDINSAPDELLPVGDSDWSNVHARLFINRTAATRWIDDAYDLADAAAMTTGPAAQVADAALTAHYAAADWRNPARDINVEPLQLIDTARRRAIQVAGARVVLAVERYRLRNGGAIPQTLADLGDLLPDALRTDPFTEQPWDYQPTPITTGWNNQPLTAHQTARPYTLSSRPLPGLTGVDPPFPQHPNHGVLITMPVEMPIGPGTRASGSEGSG